MLQRTAPNRNLKATLPKKRVLVVNCYFDDSRQPIHRTSKVPQAVGPIYLAGAFARELCDVSCYTEVASGPLEDEKMLSGIDMLVLTGLTNSFDRMLHLAAYARTKNPKVIVVAGGPPVRSLPMLARKFFDYSCMGDIEELGEVIKETFGAAYVAEEMLPRYDLAYWLGRIGYVETTRYCNFRCSFCSLTAEGHSYKTYDLEYIRRQILASGKSNRMFFLDNNFYGSDRDHFHARLDLISEMRAQGQFQHWGALVTNDFFLKQENLSRIKAAGCELLFSGLESFDNDWLRNFNKLQNTTRAPGGDDQQVAQCGNCVLLWLDGRRHHAQRFRFAPGTEIHNRHAGNYAAIIRDAFDSIAGHALLFRMPQSWFDSSRHQIARHGWHDGVAAALGSD